MTDTSFLTLDNLYASLPDASLEGKKVLVRLDLNMPMAGKSVTDTTRLQRSLLTLQELLDRQAKVIVLSHFGRPQGKDTTQDSLLPIVMIFRQYFSCPILFGSDCVGLAALTVIDQLTPGGILILENLRYHEEEEKNDPQFAKDLANLGDIYVNDAFSCSHRAHASLVGISPYLPSYAGRALEKEVQHLKQLTTSPQRPIMAIIGGAKVSTKLTLLKNLVAQMNYLVLGGGIANTFLAAQGHAIGESLYEPDLVKTAQDIMEQAERYGCQILLPHDIHVASDLETDSARVCLLKDIQPGEKIFDIGPETVSLIKKHLQDCKTLVWNGPLGVFENPLYATGSIAIAKVVAKLSERQKTESHGYEDGMTSVAGGGETLAMLEQATVAQNFTYTSTAGGAFLEWLEGKVLPGIKALEIASSQDKALGR